MDDAINTWKKCIIPAYTKNDVRGDQGWVERWSREWHKQDENYQLETNSTG